MNEKFRKFVHYRVIHALVQQGISFSNHRRARPAWGNDGFIRIKQTTHSESGRLASGCPVTRIKWGLTATGLVFIEYDIATRVFEASDGCDPDFAKVAVTQARQH